VGGGHAGADALFHPGASIAHRLPAQVKIAASLAFVAAVVLTPAHAPWALVADALIVLGLLAASGLPLVRTLQRLRIEAPFLAFAVFLPLVGGAPHVRVLGIHLSEPGLWAAWNIGAKGTIGVLVAILLSSTTPVPELLAGLERLHLPPVLVAIAGFMVRYLAVIVDQAGRMRVARLSRGDDPRWLWQARGIAATAGTLFVRSYERGERVHLAMLSRGFTGTLPSLLHRHHASRRMVAAAIALPAAPLTMAVIGRLA
jgi:cobalt/nickel transport system permease protein